MKNILWFIVLFMSMASAAGAFSFSGCEEKMFTVTAYYSPESGQAFYYKPSFQDEVTLNGEGHIGASGKKVFVGMLAWPSSYPFWSVIYFPSLGVGEIADRWGAIVLSGEKGQSYDRIDIRMGRGEEGLIRALTFGKKNLTGYFCDASMVKKDPANGIQFSAVPTLRHFFDMAIRIQQLEAWRDDIRTRTLQKYLNKLGYLNKKYRNGTFEGHTMKALCNYQVHEQIVSRNNPDCGKFGARTRYAMKLDVQSRGLLPADLYATGTFAEIIDLATYYNGKPTSAASSQPTVSSAAAASKSKIFLFYKAYNKGDQSSEIKILQNFLVAQWLYSWTIDGVYSKITMNAVYDFQKKYWLISDMDPLTLRGYLGPKTRSKINVLRQN